MWFIRKPTSDAARAARDLWRDAAPVQRAAPLHALRWICVDTETTGLDAERDALIAVGACAVEAGSIALASGIEILVRPPAPSSVRNVLVHGIGHAAQSGGQPLEEGLGAYLQFARRDVLVGCHTLFDVRMLQRAARGALGLQYQPQHLDVALLLPLLLGDAATRPADLDHWIQRFGIRPFARHHALADALATAELFLVCLERAQRRGLASLGDLLALQQKACANPPLPGGA